MRPPLRWFGSKARLAPRIVDLLPEHEHYVEVFAGSAAVLFAKRPSALETINDLSGDIVGLFRVLRDDAQCARLAEMVTLTPYSRTEFALALEPSDDPVESARRFLVRCHQAVGNSGAGWSFTVRASAVGAARIHRWEALPPRLLACVDRLRRVQVESSDWRFVVERYDKPGVVMFVDPPYEHSTRPNSTKAYEHEMTNADHEELVDRLLGLRHAAAVVTHYPHPLYDRLATGGGWAVVDMVSHADNATNKRQDPRIATNRHAPRPTAQSQPIRWGYAPRTTNRIGAHEQRIKWLATGNSFTMRYMQWSAPSPTAEQGPYPSDLARLGAVGGNVAEPARDDDTPLPELALVGASDVRPVAPLY